MEEFVLNLVERLGVLGVLVGIIFYIFHFYLPRRDKQHKESLERLAASFERMMHAQESTFRSATQSLAARQKRSSENILKLIEHLQDHERREEETLSKSATHLERVESLLAKLANRA